MKFDKSKLLSIDDHLAESLKDPEFKRLYEQPDPELEVIEKIIQLRKAAGWTQEDALREIEMAQPALSRIEQGKTNPTVRTLAKIANAYGKRLVIDFV